MRRPTGSTSLINNAARPGPPTHTVSGAGNEVTLQTNYLAPVVLTTAYAHSKLALVTYSCWSATHRPSPSLDVISMHPGVIATRLLHAMFSIAGDRPESAAANIGYVASRRGDNGTYYDQRTPRPPNPQASDPAIQNRLHDITSRTSRRPAALLDRQPKAVIIVSSNRQIVADAFCRLVGRDRVRRQHLCSGHTLGDRRQVGRVQALRQHLAVRRRCPASLRRAIQRGRALRPVNIRAIYADDEQRTVAVVWDGEGTTIAGTTYRNTYAWFMTLEGGKMVNGTAFYDNIAFNELWETVRPGG